MLAPATIIDLHDILDVLHPISPPPRMVYLSLAVQVTGGQALAARDLDGRMLALGGVVRLRGGQPAEVWFLGRPEMGMPFAVALLQTRRWLREMARGPYPDGLFIRVVPGNEAGERIARALGFAVSDVMIEGARVWNWREDEGG